MESWLAGSAKETLRVSKVMEAPNYIPGYMGERRSWPLPLSADWVMCSSLPLALTDSAPNLAVVDEVKNKSELFKTGLWLEVHSRFSSAATSAQRWQGGWAEGDVFKPPDDCSIHQKYTSMKNVCTSHWLNKKSAYKINKGVSSVTCSHWQTELFFTLISQK